MSKINPIAATIVADQKLKEVSTLLECIREGVSYRTEVIVGLQDRVSELEVAIERIVEAPSWALRREIADEVLKAEAANEPA